MIPTPENIVNKTTSTAKSAFNALSSPINAKYVKKELYEINAGLSYDKRTGKLFRNIDDDGWLPAAHFFVIFGKKYNIHIYKGEYWGNRNESFAIEFPQNGFYYIQIDKKTICTCKISTTVGRTRSNDNMRNFIQGYTDMEIKFIGANCHYWYDHYYILASKLCSSLIKKNNDTYSNNYSANLVYHYEGMKRPVGGCHINTKNIDELFFSKNFNKDVLLNKIYAFSKSKNFYISKHIPYRLGILLYGKPGTGKSSFASALASMLNVSVCIVSPEDIYLSMTSDKNNDIVFCRDKGSLKSDIKAVILIEEIDSLISTEIDGKTKKGTLRKDQLVKFLDTKISENCIVVSTTNVDIDDPENDSIIDPALIRAGRFDIKLKMNYFDKENAIKMIESYGLDKSFADKYDDKYPICPSELQFDIIQTVIDEQLNLSKDKEENNNDTSITF